MSLPTTEKEQETKKEPQPQTYTTTRAKNSPILDKVIEYVATANKNGVPIRDMDWNTARSFIMEGMRCSKSTAYKAYRTIREKQKQDRKPSKPQIVIAKQEGKKPDFISETEAETPIEELPPAAEPIMDMDYFRDMLRSVHAGFLSKDGLLGEKYGRSIEQCNVASDSLCRYLSKRVAPTDLEKYDLIFVLVCYLPIATGILNEFRKDRAAQSKTKKPAAPVELRADGTTSIHPVKD